MTARDSNFANAFETTLASTMGPTDLVASVATTTGGPITPCYLVIEPDSATQREYIYFDGTFDASTFRTTGIGNRFLTGSAAASGLTHPSGSKVRSAPVAQHFDDLHDRVDGTLAKSTFTTKGDIVVATGASTPVRRGVGADNTYLQAASAQTDGVQWQTAGAVGDIVASAVGDTAAAGAVGKPADAGHRHAREAFGSPVASAVGDTQSAGVATTDARSDHRHAREAFGSPVATSPTANSDGVASTDARSDHKHIAPGTLAYTAITSDQASIGTSNTDVTGGSATAAVVSGRRVKVTGFLTFTIGASASVAIIRIFEGATQLAECQVVLTGAGFATSSCIAVLTPSAGSHTYKLVATCNAGTVTSKASATTPAFILVEDIGV